MTNPRVRFILKFKGFDVYIVDGFLIRDRIDEQFTNFGQHFRFPFIPSNEFWIDRGVSDKETGFFLEHLFVEYTAMRRGASYKNALDQANVVERKLRLEADGKINKCDPKRARLRLYRRMPDGTRVYIVDGDYVRDSSGDVNYTEGGHGYVYKYVPKGEIWIDVQLQSREIPLIVEHEYVEQHLMRDKGMPYERAHVIASKEEFKMRKREDPEASLDLASVEKEASA